MKALGILGTSSDAGKSWFTTALCAWLKRQGVRVAPFKAQNMSNNAYATLDGGEIGIAQAVQAHACGLTPTVEMNPILLKPTGDSKSQLIRLGKVVAESEAHDYYQTIQDSWKVVAQTLEDWESKCDVLLMEGAGSPVELNIAKRDIANFRPIRHVDGKWLLVADIERGGVFAQIAGTWQLAPKEDQRNALGYVVNKFRGDPTLFPNPEAHLKAHCPLPYLGLLPKDNRLRIDEEDSLSSQNSINPETGSPQIVWIRLPHVSNSQDIQTWRNDTGIDVQWADTPEAISNAAAIIIPGTKNTIADLKWLNKTGLSAAIISRAQVGVPVVGICGGYQILGATLHDPGGVAGESGSTEGLGLIPITTTFSPQKTVAPRRATYEDETWETYEIHSGQSQFKKADNVQPLLHLIKENESQEPEGYQRDNIWGSYQHGLFDSSRIRERFIQLAGIQHAKVCPVSRKAHDEQTFNAMADLIHERLNLETVSQYLGLKL